MKFKAPRIQDVENKASGALIEVSNTSNARPSSQGHKNSATAMPHPILKKSQGPSNTGPRPTARFVSPHDSEDEKENEEIISQNEHVIIRPPTPEIKEEQESQNLLKVPQISTNRKRGKGHVVATVAGRRRPAIVRRKSSQSAGEEQEPRENPEKKPSNQDKQPTALDTRGLGNSLNKGSSGGAIQTSKLLGGKPTSSGSAGPGPSTMKAKENTRISSQAEGELDESEPNEEEWEEFEVQKLLLAEASARMKRGRPSGGNSQILRQNLRSMSLSNLRLAGEPSDTKGKASIAPRYEDATGEINMDVPIPTKTQQHDKGKGRELKDALRFPKRTMASFVAKNHSIDKLANPTMMSKSQSQLSLLLHQQRKPETDQQSSKGKGKEKRLETGSEDTQDEGLEMPPKEKKKK